MKRPQVSTALPKRRYQLGTFSAVVLGDVRSPDPRSYLYILALVPEGEQDPVLYVTCESLPEPAEDGQRTIVRVIAEEGEKALGPNDAWQDLDAFADDAVAMVQKVMRLGDEIPARLL
jgi:hypothetical protein